MNINVRNVMRSNMSIIARIVEQQEDQVSGQSWVMRQTTMNPDLIKSHLVIICPDPNANLFKYW